MDKKYGKFVEELMQLLLKETEMDKSDIYYVPKGGKENPEKDRIFIKIHSMDCNTKDAYSFFVEELYKRYLTGSDIDKIAELILSEYKTAQDFNLLRNTRNMVNYEAVKGYLFVRPMNYARHKEELMEIAYELFADIALVLYMRIGESGGDIFSFKIREEYLKQWNCDRKSIFEAALENTKLINPPKLFFLEKLMQDDDSYNGDDFLDCTPDMDLNSSKFLVSTVFRNSGGAIAAFIPEILKRLSELMEGNLYIVFLGSEEFLAVNAIYVQQEVLMKSYADALDNSEYEDIIFTSHIYFYDKDSAELKAL